MASKPPNTDNVGLGISGAEVPADQTQPSKNEPERPESPEQLQDSLSDSSEDLECEDVDPNAPRFKAPAEIARLTHEMLNRKQPDQQAPDRVNNDAEVVEEWENFVNYNSPEQDHAETGSHFSSSSEDEDEKAGLKIGHAQHKSADNDYESLAWTPERLQALEEYRGYFYQEAPSTVWGQRGDGPEDPGEVYYLSTALAVVHGTLPKAKERRDRTEPFPLIPTKLRKTRSVDDISPETSPKADETALTQGGDEHVDGADDAHSDGSGEEHNGPKTVPDTASQQGGPSESTTVSVPPAVGWKPATSWSDLDDEEGDVLGEYIRRNSNAGTQDQLTPEEPLPVVRPSTPTQWDTDTSFEQPPLHHSLPEGGSLQDEGDAKPPPQDVESPGDDAKGEGLSSPTLSNASSVESTTGMTQSQGLKAADDYIEKTEKDLVKQRSKLKDEFKGDPENPKVDRLKEDPLARIELLEAKVHTYRKKRDESEATADRIRGKCQDITYNYNTLVDTYKDLAHEHNDATEFNERQRGVVEDLKKRNVSLLEQLEDAERKEREWYDKWKQKKMLVQQWKVYAELNVELAECERRRREIGTQDAKTDTGELLPSTIDDADLVGTSTDADTQTHSLDVQIERPTTSHTGTQTDETGLSQQNTTSAGNGGDFDIDSVLPPNAVRWPPRIREEAAQHIARWINERHAKETSRQIAPLTSDIVRDMLGPDGTTSFQRLAALLDEAGYAFRTDRFGQDIARFMYDHDTSSLEAMYAERHLRPRSNPIAQLLEEIAELQVDLDESNLIRRGLGAMPKNATDLEEELQNQIAIRGAFAAENDELRQELKACEEELRTSRATQLQAANAEEHAQIDTKEIGALRTRIQECQAEAKRQRADYEFLDGLLEECHAHSSKADGEIGALKSELASCRKHGEQLLATTTALESEKNALQVNRDELELALGDRNTEVLELGAKADWLRRELDELNQQREREGATSKNANSRPAVDTERIRLQREFDQVVAQRDKLVEYLQVARKNIESLNARAKELATNNRYLQARITQLEVPGTPILELPSTPRQQAQLDSPPSPFPSPMPRSPGLAALPHTPATPSFRLAQPARWAARESRIENSDAYQKTREALRKKREAEEQEQARLSERREGAYKKLCNWDEIPYVPVEERWQSSRKLAKAAW